MEHQAVHARYDAKPALYVGRFAPTPSGPLHLGSVVAALASWLDARAHRGRWLIRIEDTDTQRSRPGVDRLILHQLELLGLETDEPVVWQSKRAAIYERALQHLIDQRQAYPCACTRKQLSEAGFGSIYPGLCRQGLPAGAVPRAWRFRLPCNTTIHYCDRALGWQHEDVAQRAGDFVLKRADGDWAYQLAVVVDDADQGVTDVVRGQDLLDNTGRQRLLQNALGYANPQTLHVPLVRLDDGRKLSKSHGATAAPCDTPELALRTLQTAWQHLGFEPILPTQKTRPSDFLRTAIVRWGERYGLRPPPSSTATGAGRPDRVAGEREWLGAAATWPSAFDADGASGSS